MKSKVLGLVLSALVLVLCGWIYSRQGVLRFSSVDIENVQDEDLVLGIKRRVAPFLGANLLTLSLSDVQRGLLLEPRIKKVFISRKLPSTLSLKIVERLPVAITQGEKPLVIGDEGVTVEGLTFKERLPVWVGYEKSLPVLKEKVSHWLADLKASQREYFDRISEMEWVENRGLVLSVQNNAVDAGIVFVDMGTEDFAQKWQRVKLVLNYMSEQQIHGERLMALGDGQVVISGVKNLHNLKNELNLKEIVRRATLQSEPRATSDTRVQAR